MAEFEGGDDEDDVHRHGRHRGGEDVDPEEEEFDEYDDEGSAFWHRVYVRFPKTSIWLYTAIMFAAMRSATTFVIILAFLTIPARAL